MKSLEEIFELARNLPENEREPFLLENCGGDLGSLNQLRELLAAADEADRFFPSDDLAERIGRHDSDKTTELPSPELLEKSLRGVKVIEMIAQGGMGAVYKACQVDLDREVAIKILPPETSHYPGFAERFRREARAMAKLDHQNIVTVHEFGQTDDGLFFIIMSYVDGASLAQVLETGQLAPHQALGLVSQLCDALQYAHSQGVVHRDIKPGNILLSKDGQIKVADFGIAKLYENDPADTQLTRPGMSVGTPDYIAPEQTADSRSVDHRADIYSMGVVFYQMLTGEIPKGVFAPPSSKSQVDPRLDPVVMKAMKSEPEKRYQHASEIKTDIGEIQSSQLENINVSKPKRKWGRLALATVVVVLVIAVLPIFITTNSEQNSPPDKKTRAPGSSDVTKDPAIQTTSIPIEATMGKPFVNSLGMRFVPIPITGGSPNDKTILFCIWETRVQDYQKFAENRATSPKPESKSLTSEGWGTYGATWKKPGFPQTKTDPVVCVSFVDSCLFTDWLSRKEGLSYRLPTDHEWSCAVRIGDLEDPSLSPSEKSGRYKNIFPWGRNGLIPSPNSANYAGLESIAGQEPPEWKQEILPSYKDFHSRTAPVGSYHKNQLGLHDLGGNVWEWCDSLFVADQKNHVIRGGSWSNGTWNALNSSYRNDIPPTSSFSDTGFRIVLEITN